MYIVKNNKKELNINRKGITKKGVRKSCVLMSFVEGNLSAYCILHH